MPEYVFSNALNYNHTQLSEMHNASFQGYFFPLEMTAEMSADFWRVNQIDAGRSVVMHDEQGTFVGITRVGTRGKRGWCGGFGIVPAFRRTGASTLLARRMLRVARESELETLQLEVLAQNVSALKLYEKVGFTTTRRLVGLEGTSASLPSDARFTVEHVPVGTLLPACYNGRRPAWSNEPASLLTMHMHAFVLPDSAGRTNGLLVQRANEKMRVAAALLQPDVTTPELAALLRQAAGEAQSIQVYNEAEDDLFPRLCRQLGFNEWFSQYEMLIQL